VGCCENPGAENPGQDRFPGGRGDEGAVDNGEEVAGRPFEDVASGVDEERLAGAAATGEIGGIETVGIRD
jgi:hypothetical protein